MGEADLMTLNRRAAALKEDRAEREDEDVDEEETV